MDKAILNALQKIVFFIQVINVHVYVLNIFKPSHSPRKTMIA